MTERVDVAVVGGGTAGIAAALSSARLGARTLLIERADQLGGNATQALVHTFCGLYLPAEDGRVATYANPGAPQRFAEELRRVGGAADPERVGRVWVLPIVPPVLSHHAAAACDAAPALERKLGAEVVGVSLGAASGAGLVVSDTDGTHDVECAIVVDTTGDGTVAALAGAETMMASPSELQRPSFIFRVGPVYDYDARGFARLRISVAAAGAVRAGALPSGCESVLVRSGGSDGDLYVTLNLPPLNGRPYDPFDANYVDELYRLGKARGEALVEYLRRTRAEFRDARIVAWPHKVGIRETRRVRGRAVLTSHDVLSGKRTDDGVVLSSWPIEIWQSHRGAQFEYPAAPCSIPLDALISSTHGSLGMAGRCMSASHRALGALRVIGTALASGEAIGVAAALAAGRRESLTAVAPSDVRATIRRCEAE